VCVHLQVRLADVLSSWAIGAPGGAGAGAGSGAGSGTKNETADTSDTASIRNGGDGVAAASAAASVPNAAVGQASSTSHDDTPLRPSGVPYHNTLFASPTGTTTTTAHHCSMLDTTTPVFLALADALSAHVVNRVTPVLDAGLSNSLHVMYQVIMLGSVADHMYRGPLLCLYR
jgi:hypothetical protein